MSKARARMLHRARHALCLLPVLAGCGGEDSTGPDGDGDATIPASWAGVWSVQTTSRDCDTGEMGETTELDTLCAGQPFQFEFDVGKGTIIVPCTGTIGETAFDIDCSSRPTVPCPVDVLITLAGTRSGDTFTGTGRFNGTPSADCGPGATPLCFDLTITGTRTSSDTPGCAGRSSRLSSQVGPMPGPRAAAAWRASKQGVSLPSGVAAFRFSERKRTVVTGRVP